MVSLRLCRHTLRAVAVAAALALPSWASAEELQVVGDRLFLNAQVNGVAVEALLDSGAELSVADAAFAETAKIGGGSEVAMRGTGAGESRARIVEGVRIAAAGVTLPAATIA